MISCVTHTLAKACDIVCQLYSCEGRCHVVCQPHSLSSSIRASKAKFTVKFAQFRRRRLSHTAILTVNLPRAQVATEVGGLTEEKAHDWIKDLRKKKRYVEDVWS